MNTEKTQKLTEGILSFDRCIMTWLNVKYKGRYTWYSETVKLY